MEKKMLDILVVESGFAHVCHAEDYFLEQSVHFSDVKTLREAREYLINHTPDGIICDIFMDTGYGSEEDMANKEEVAAMLHICLGSNSRYHIGIDEWCEPNKEGPMGVLLYEEFAESIPFVFCTDRNHHNELMEPVFQYVLCQEEYSVLDRLNAGRVLVDAQCDPLCSVERKNWGHAHKVMGKLIDYAKDNELHKVKPPSYFSFADWL
ncbi:hypothetical protein CL622_00585 [archaeon]|nr:hypothetical protein [archaeon]|tara:strand:- start:1234 stop:1857 length:624 start_codon:yes stop_codon:yes gene_type:complete